MDDFWRSILWLHVLAMAFFVGGQLVLAAAVVPAGLDRPHLRAVARRFGYGTLVAIGVLLATGVALASHFHLWGDSTLHVKLALVAAVAVLVVWHIKRPAMHALEAGTLLLSLVIVWLGLSLATGS
jgi:uncharacterized membrane protein